MYSQNNKIMVIDDDYRINNLIKFFLQKDGYHVDSFTGSIEALDSFRKDEYDLVLLDSKIPELKQMSLYKKFKEIDNKVSICFTNADMESLEEIKKQAQEIYSNNIIFTSFSFDNHSKVDILLMENTDTILLQS
jgi:DNA-binding response OmpR family regulator